MADLKVAFWNVNNLLEPSNDDRGGPRTSEELEAKVRRIADVLNSLFEDRGPDLIGLAEIHTTRIAESLAQHLNGPYHLIFERCDATKYAVTGLTVLARKQEFGSIARIQAWKPTAFARPRWLIVQCEFNALLAPIFFVVNHWTSRFTDNRNPDGGAEDRRLEAEKLRDWLQEAGQVDKNCVVVIGDFNAEPFEDPFGEFGLNSRRHLHRRHLLPSNALYNTAWRFLAEPDSFEAQENMGDAYQASRPKTTFDTRGSPDNLNHSVIFDQLLVSKLALRGGPISLQESSVAYAAFTNEICTIRDGHHRPRRWSYIPERASGASDHFPLVAKFRMNVQGEYQ